MEEPNLLRLVFDQFGDFLGKKGNRYVIKNEGIKKEIFSSDVEEIFLLNPGISISVSALRLALSHETFVILGNRTGWPHGFIIPSSLSTNIAARRQQFLALLDFRGSFLAKKFVLGKTTNQINLLKLLSKNRRKIEPQTADIINNSSEEINSIVNEINDTNYGQLTIDDIRMKIMNLEGRAAKIYWNVLSSTIFPEQLGFKGREGKGASDPINMMLNFGYKAILFAECSKALYYTGLDPFAGYLHTDRPGKASLSLDLMEEFRQPIVDRSVISIISRKMVNFNEIITKTEKENQTQNRLSHQIIKLLIQYITSHINGQVNTKNDQWAEINVKKKNIIQTQATKIVKYLMDPSTDYQPYKLKW